MEKFTWEPLPPRGGRRNRSRGGLTVEASSSPEESQLEKHRNDKQKQPAKRINRPGFNSYLKVLLDQKTIETLHRTTLEIQSELAKSQDISAAAKESNNPSEEYKIPTNDNTVTEEQGGKAFDEDTQSSNPATVDSSTLEDAQHTEGKIQQQNDTKNKKKTNNLKIKPRGLNSLHMTFFFGGETLSALTPEALTEWHSAVQSRLEKSNFFLESSDGITEDEKADDEAIPKESLPNENNLQSDPIFWFRIKELRTFPPKRNNLVVAVLEASPEWHTLYEDIRDIARKSSCSELRELVTPNNNKDKWTPHITLANIIPPRGKKLVLDNLLQEKTKTLTTNESEVEQDEQKQNIGFSAHSYGISMGGPIPKQAQLDWNFCFKQNKS